MIVVRLSGGVGNQLFQFALGHGLAAKTGHELILDKSQFRSGAMRRRGYPPHHKDYLKNLDLPYSSATTVAGVFKEYFVRATRESSPLRWQVVRPPAAPSFILEAAKNRNLFLAGHWQSLEYVAAYADDLRTILMTHLTISDAYADYVDLINTQEMTSVHLRFGDYVSVASNAQKYHHVNKRQLMGAIHDLEQRQSSVSLLVFSDDTDKAQAFFKANDDVRFVKATNADPISELALMASCRHHIISNSTFSWWSAYLGDSNNSLVYCPKRWRRDIEFELRLPNWKLY
jgi:hypothetical protein